MVSASDLSVVINDFSLLSQCDPADFFSIVFQVYFSPSKEVVDQLSSFAHNNGLSLVDLRKLLAFCLDFIRLSYQSSPSVASVRADLSSFNMPSESVSIFLELYTQNRHKAMNSFLEKSIHTSTLIDMDWRFGVSAVENNVPVGSGFVQMSLKLQDQDGSQNNVVFELSISDFYMFLSKMQRVKVTIDSYY
ncbi:hypothetical protein GEMRC1_003315 [Eukaryota sp. GEM-RC1]